MHESMNEVTVKMLLESNTTMKKIIYAKYWNDVFYPSLSFNNSFLRDQLYNSWMVLLLNYFNSEICISVQSNALSKFFCTSPATEDDEMMILMVMMII
jgi:hypothetical protein